MKKILSGYHGGRQSSVTRIVIHGTVSPCQAGGAQSVARYFQSPSTGGSAHYVVDPGEVVCCVDEHTIAYHAPPNTGSIGVELCDPQKGASSRWGDAAHEAMLRRAAVLVREVAARWGVPLKKLTVAQVKAGQHGICGHVDVSKAFKQTDHSDPGTGFPWAHFMDLVTDGAAVAEIADDGTSFTEDIVKDLPELKAGANNYDVKTLKAALFARGAVTGDRFADVGLQAWLEDMSFDAELTAVVKAFQKSKKLDADGICGPLTWGAALRVS
jgi:N-acetyl-anhydromuramyl-L-alanine amidase AmpD